MKISKIRMLFLAILSTFVFMMANAQTCDWTVENRCDCTPKIAVKQDCNGTITQGDLTQITAGSWDQPTTTIIHDQPCDPNCTFTILMENSNNPLAEYSDGDVFCCNGPDKDCVTNNCVKIIIDESTHSINFIKPPNCK